MAPYKAYKGYGVIAGDTSQEVMRNYRKEIESRLVLPSPRGDGSGLTIVTTLLADGTYTAHAEDENRVVLRSMEGNILDEAKRPRLPDEMAPQISFLGRGWNEADRRELRNKLIGITVAWPQDDILLVIWDKQTAREYLATILRANLDGAEGIQNVRAGDISSLVRKIYLCYGIQDIKVGKEGDDDSTSIG